MESMIISSLWPMLPPVCAAEASFQTKKLIKLSFEQVLWHRMFNLWGPCQRHMVELILAFWHSSTLIWSVAAPVCNPTNTESGFPFPHILSSSCLKGPSCWLLILIPGQIESYSDSTFLNLYHVGYCICFLLGVSVFQGFTSMSLIHLELNFV